VSISNRLIAAMVVASICGIHFGANEFVSVQFTVFLVLALWLLPTLIGYPMKMVPAGLCLLGLVTLPAIVADHESNIYLRGLRTVFVMLLLYAATIHTERRKNPLRAIAVVTGVRWAILASLVLGICQLLDSIAFNTGIFDIPNKWFSLDYGTLFAERRQALAPAGYFIRPSSFYSEPSAFAALGLLGLLCGFTTQDQRLKLTSSAILLVSMSLIGIAFGIVFWFLLERSRRARILALCVSVLLLGIFSQSENVVITRIQTVAQGADISTGIRVQAPLSIIGYLLDHGLFFGANQTRLSALIPSDLNSVFNNWLFNQLMFFGVLGVFLAASPFFLLRHAIWPLIAAYAVTNGDAFYYDRFALLLIAIYVTSINWTGPSRNETFYSKRNVQQPGWTKAHRRFGSPSAPG
jgi:hypothetical protein